MPHPRKGRNGNKKGPVSWQDFNIFNLPGHSKVRKRELFFPEIREKALGIRINFFILRLFLSTCTCKKFLPKGIFARMQGFLHEKGAV